MHFFSSNTLEYIFEISVSHFIFEKKEIMVTQLKIFNESLFH